MDLTYYATATFKRGWDTLLDQPIGDTLQTVWVSMIVEPLEGVYNAFVCDDPKAQAQALTSLYLTFAGMQPAKGGIGAVKTGIANKILPGKVAKPLRNYWIDKMASRNIRFNFQRFTPRFLRHNGFENGTIYLDSAMPKRGVFFEEIQHAIDYLDNPETINVANYGSGSQLKQNLRAHQRTFENMADSLDFPFTDAERHALRAQAQEWRRQHGNWEDHYLEQ